MYHYRYIESISCTLTSLACLYRYTNYRPFQLYRTCTDCQQHLKLSVGCNGVYISSSAVLSSHTCTEDIASLMMK